MTTKLLDGEQELLGRGVSYCATCDGRLYEGKKIAVLCNAPKFEHEVEFLADLASEVFYFPTYESNIEKENVTICKDMPKAVCGEEYVEQIRLTSGKTVDVDGIFCLRNAIAPATLVPGLEIADGHIVTDRQMATNLPGCYAAGDCTGRPYQYTKAAGEGNVAAHSVVSYLAE